MALHKRCAEEVALSVRTSWGSYEPAAACAGGFRFDPAERDGGLRMLTTRGARSPTALPLREGTSHLSAVVGTSTATALGTKASA